MLGEGPRAKVTVLDIAKGVKAQWPISDNDHLGVIASYERGARRIKSIISLDAWGDMVVSERLSPSSGLTPREVEGNRFEFEGGVGEKLFMTDGSIGKGQVDLTDTDTITVERLRGGVRVIPRLGESIVSRKKEKDTLEIGLTGRGDFRIVLSSNNPRNPLINLFDGAIISMASVEAILPELRKEAEKNPVGTALVGLVVPNCGGIFRPAHFSRT